MSIDSKVCLVVVEWLSLELDFVIFSHGFIWSIKGKGKAEVVCNLNSWRQSLK